MPTFMLLLTVYISPVYNDTFLIDYNLSESDCAAMLADYLPPSGNPAVHLSCELQK